MRTYTRLLLGALAAALVLASAVNTASAGRLSTSEVTFRQVWTPLNFAAGGITIRCNVTLEGSFHYRTIIKALEKLIGYVTQAAVTHPCTNGEAWALNGVERVLGGVAAETLPWHLTYEGFEGTLPNITGVRLLLRPSFLTNVAGVLCLYTGNVQGVAKLTRGVVSGIVPDSTIGVGKASGGIFCPSSGTFGLDPGAGNSATVLGSATAITITLI